MKISGFLGIVLGLVLAFTTSLAASASVQDPGVTPVDELLLSTEVYTPEKDRVYNSAQILDSLEKSNLEHVLEVISHKYGVEFVVEYLRTYPTAEPGAWSDSRSAQLGVAGTETPAAYFSLAVGGREFWIIGNEKFNEKISDDELSELIDAVAVPNFKEDKFLRGIGITADALARAYNNLPVFDSISPAAPNVLVTPSPEASAGLLAPVESERTSENPPEPQEELGEVMRLEEESSSIDFGTVLIIASIVVGLGILLLVIVVIRKAILGAARARKLKLEALEDKRLEKLAEQLVPRLRHSDEFMNAESLEERLKIADKASFTVYGLRATDKEAVVRLAESLVSAELRNGVS